MQMSILELSGTGSRQGNTPSADIHRLQLDQNKHEVAREIARKIVPLLMVGQESQV